MMNHQSTAAKNGLGLPGFLARGIRRNSFFFPYLGIALAFLMATTASAQTVLTVTTTADRNDQVCVTSATSTCSLRDAIYVSNHTTSDTVEILVRGGLYNLDATLGPLNITRSVTIVKGARDVTISGQGSMQIMQILDISGSGVSVTLSGLNFQRGNSSGDGGAIKVYGNANLNIDQSTFAWNRSTGQGGAIYDANGVLTVTNSTFYRNSAGTSGGAIDVTSDSSGTPQESLTVVNSTFYNNTADSDDGGAIYSNIPSSVGQLTVVNGTFVGNNASGGAAIYDTGLPKLETVENNIFSGNGNTSSGEAVSLAYSNLTEDYNLFYNNNGGDGLGGLYGPDDVTGIDPDLVSLNKYGSPMETMMPEAESPAICAGDASALRNALAAAQVLEPGISKAEDERGFPIVGTLAYCGDGSLPGSASNVDIGSVQTNYLLIGPNNLKPFIALGMATNAANTDTDIGFTYSTAVTRTPGSPWVIERGTYKNIVIIGPHAPNTVTFSGQVKLRDPSTELSSLMVIKGEASSSVTLYGLTFENNNTHLAQGAGPIRGGGGIALIGVVLNVYDSIFSDLQSEWSGGAISSCTYGSVDDPSTGTLNIKGSTFSGNSTAAEGGAICGYYIDVTDSTFYNNSQSPCTIQACSGSGGGAIAVDQYLNATGNIFSNNSTTNMGNAIEYAYNAIIFDNIFIDNTNIARPDLTNPVDSPLVLNYATADYNLLYDNAGYGYPFLGSHNVIDSSTNSPVKALGYYGGPTPTMPPVPGSPAICAGIAFIPYPPEDNYINLKVSHYPLLSANDQRGYPRLNTAYNTSSPCIDIGSVQTDYHTTVATTTTVLFSTTPLVYPAAADTAVYGNTVTLTAVVTAADGTNGNPAGTESFTINDGTPVSGTLAACPSGTVANSTCYSYSTNTLNPGSYLASASFTPANTDFFKPSSSSALSFTVASATDYVSYLGGQNILKSGQVNSLTREWNKAIQMGSDGKLSGAINNLNDFIAEVNDLYSSGVLNQDEETALNDAANYQISLY